MLSHKETVKIFVVFLPETCSNIKLYNDCLFFSFKRSFVNLQGELVEYYYTWKKTPTALSSRPHRRRRHNVLRRKALPRTSKNIVSEFGKCQTAVFRDCCHKWLRLQAESLSFSSFEPFLSSVDLSSCSEDDYDSDDSERDLRLVKVVFLCFAFPSCSSRVHTWSSRCTNFFSIVCGVCVSPRTIFNFQFSNLSVLLFVGCTVVGIAIQLSLAAGITAVKTR